jgi:hypothetical protein
MQWNTVIMVLLAGCTVACGSTTSDSESEPDAGSAAERDSGGDANDGQTPTNEEIEALQVEGTWIFSYRPGFMGLARYEGAANIVESCLVVGDCIVVWRDVHIQRARDTVSAVLGGENPVLALGGYGRLVVEGYAMPAAVTDYCPSAAGVWYDGSQDP